MQNILPEEGILFTIDEFLEHGFLHYARNLYKTFHIIPWDENTLLLIDHAPFYPDYPYEDKGDDVVSVNRGRDHYTLWHQNSKDRNIAKYNVIDKNSRNPKDFYIMAMVTLEMLGYTVSGYE